MIRSFSSVLVFFLGLLTASLVHADAVKFGFDNSIALNSVKFEIPAPIETTRAQNESVSGSLEIDVDDLKKTRGSIKVDLLDIKGFTFTDSGKNKTQTDHMLNWFEVGSDVNATMRETNRWASFNITNIASVTKLGSSFNNEIGKGQSYQIKAQGDFMVHGISKKKTADLIVVIYDVPKDGTRYQKAQRIAMIRSKEPLKVSLKEHDVKPRDTAGKFLSTALSVVGLKISDEALVSLDLRAYQAR